VVATTTSFLEDRLEGLYGRRRGQQTRFRCWLSDEECMLLLNSRYNEITVGFDGSARRGVCIAAADQNWKEGLGCNWSDFGTKMAVRLGF